MIYIKDSDYEYIANKYHDTKKPFDPHVRYIRRDEIFDESTGMNGDDIKKGIFENDKQYEHLPHCIRKARGLEFVLKNTRISCDSRDIFPAINSTDRLLRVTLSDMWRNEILQNVIPENHAERINLQRKGVATIWLDYDHSVPIWDRLFDLGFRGILADSENIRKQKGKLDKEKDAFYESIKIEYEAIIGIVKRMNLLAKNTKGSEKLATALENIAENSPKTFYEALLVIYIYFMICEHIEGLQVRSLCNFDRQLYKFYKHDIENGVSEEQIREEIAYFLMQFTAIGNYWGQPVYLGGENADGSSVINELSYIFVDVYDKMGIFNPKVQIKVAQSTPEKFMLKVLDMIRRGRNSFVLVGDETIRKSLIKNLGVTEEEARLCDVKGCYEYARQGDFATGMNYLNLVKPLEFVLHGGYDGIDQSFILQKSPAPYEYKTFDDLYAEYKKQLFALIDKTVEIVNGYENYLSEINPLPMLSATIPECLEKGLDAIARKSVSCSSLMMFGAIADVVDSLTMIKKYVYDRKELTLEEFVRIIDNNFEGYELFRQKLLNDREKYGNKYVGRPIKVETYTSADKVEWFVNGKKIGESIPKKAIASIETVYEKGYIEAIAYKNGNVYASYKLETCEKASHINLSSQSEELIADNRNLCYVDITITDKTGRLCTDYEGEIECTVLGAELMGIYSANPCNEDDYTSNKCHIFKGRALAVLRTKTKGKVTLTVYNDELTSATFSINAVENSD